mmetsp:Transcript_8857/g.13220  ORF Transcript_8857/g.13220 Transcript_8857/m.13220 type:complete len:268 (-) Transcript_8857:116-919(-)
MVFSGIVQEMGKVKSLEEAENVKMWNGEVTKGTIMKVEMKSSLEDAYIDCSIAINGVCLTVIAIDKKESTAAFGLAPETLRRSNLGSLKVGSPVNVEPSLKNTDRNSGHYVQGHVDCTGKILKKTKDGDSLRMRIGDVPKQYMEYIVEKGYIAIDGTSLTITDVNVEERSFEYMLIPHTQASVIMPLKDVNETINIEVDVMAKYASQNIHRIVDGRISALKAKVDDGITPLKTQVDDSIIPLKTQVKLLWVAVGVLSAVCIRLMLKK